MWTAQSHKSQRLPLTLVSLISKIAEEILADLVNDIKTVG